MRLWLACNHRFLVLVFLFCLLIGPSAADVSGLDIAPSSIVIKAESGRDSSTGITVMNLAGYPQNLTFSFVRTTATDTVKVLETRDVTFPEGEVRVSPQESTDIPIDVATGSLESGEYKGTLRVLSNGSISSIPLDVKVRVPLGLPLTVLLVTVVASVFFFYFGPSWRKRATLKRNSALIRSKVIADKEMDKTDFARYFRQKVWTVLDDADAKILNEDYTAAEKALEDAGKFWNWWYYNRETWIPNINKTVTVMNTITEIEAKFMKFSDTCVFFNELRDKYHKFWREGVNPTSDNNLDTTPLNDLYDFVVKIQTILGYLEQTREFCYDLGDEKKKLCCGKLKSYAVTLRDKELAELNTGAIKKDLEVIRNEFPPDTPPKPLRDTPESPEMRAMVRAPGRLKLKSPAEEVDNLTWWINAFEFASTLLLIPIVLTLMGIYALYYQNATFGSFFDYLGLIIWGIMSCATNEGIWTNVVSLNPLPKKS